jgi:ABC-type transporter Mla MlaB component
VATLQPFRRPGRWKLIGPNVVGPMSCSDPRSLRTEMATIVLVLSGPVARSDIPAVCDQVQTILASAGPGATLCCDVAELDPPDAAALDALARIQLLARRRGRRIRLRHARPELKDLVAFCGLAGVLPCGPALPVQPRRQPEQREQRGRVEEEGDPGDPVV